MVADEMNRGHNKYGCASQEAVTEVGKSEALIAPFAANDWHFSYLVDQ